MNICSYLNIYWHLCVVAIEKGAFVSPFTTVANLYIYRVS